ncbi:uncharacterized protein FA14DRAFT_160078 [Meira miltonrushii]|uniref:Exoribonuclease phosphorolytic domain-containing protein n=1 Tax=Meira miltonrushii TaxID=1280837 RepID=A0A316VA59_9BASI|nr:uncharacterized protein FA14DRAFT_160078 [Meira miltonrushii]PWN34489.1 hypothetical protein FA14DRAFT_160078 [Meira miltonrushii]
MAGTSTFDRRRINGPETIQPTFALPTTFKKQRSASERQGVHSLFIQTGLVAQASGSAYFESNSVKAACSVFGPRQQSQQNRSQSSATGGSSAGAGSAARSYTNEAELTVDCRFASFATHTRKRAGKDTESSTLASTVRLALLPSIRLDKLPKATIDVFITILQADAGRGQGSTDDEACAAAAATVASCALANAGIELYGLVVGVHGVWGHADGIIVDATHAEAARAKASLTLWSMPALGAVTSLDQTGHMSLEEMEKLLTLLQTASATIHLKAAKAIQDGFKQRHLGES